MLQTLLSFFVNRRFIKRIPCAISAHFLINIKGTLHRGAATITDITTKGLCCNHMKFFHAEHGVVLKKHTEVTIYFTLPSTKGSSHNFELKGIIRSCTSLAKGSMYRVGILLSPVPTPTFRDLQTCIARLKEQIAKTTT